MTAAGQRTPAAESGERLQSLRAYRRAYRVLTLAPTFFFADYGCHVRILEESLALQRSGVQIAVCTYRGGRSVPGIRTERIVGLPWRRGVDIGSSAHKLYLDPLLTLKALQVAAWFRPNVIHAHLHEGAFIGYPLSRLCRAPLIFDYQGSLTAEMIDHGFVRRDSGAYPLLRQLEGRICRRADAIVTSTRYAASLLDGAFGCTNTRIHPVPDGVNVDTFRPRWSVDSTHKAHLRWALGIPEGRRLVVYLGLLAEYQGASHMLHAAATLLEDAPDTHFLLMGFPGQDRYQGLANSLGIASHVTFTGRVPYEQAPSYLALGDLAVSPKMSGTEGNGKLLNYMAVGLPTVAFDTPVNREILGDLGEYARFGDSDDLARAMGGLLADPRASEERGAALRERAAERFSWSQGGQQILDVYESLA